MATELSRRSFCQSSVGALMGASLAATPFASWSAEPPAAGNKLPRVAAINSIYRLRSHAYHIAGRFIHGYTIGGKPHQPPFQLVRMFNDQTPNDDLGPSVCQKYGVELAKSAEAAISTDGKLDVDAVLLIIEHGDYPVNSFGQVEYPRFDYFERIMRVFEKSGRSVPVFVDKHLSYDHRKAARMVEWSRKLGFGMMAGSSLPVTWRRPELEPDLETPFEEAVVVFGFDRGTTEIYWFHALEVLQSMLERRHGGETGVKSVRCLSGDAVWKAGDDGLWSWELMHRALSRCGSRNYGKVREQVLKPELILVEYLDGTRGAALNLVEATSEFAFAGRIKGVPEPVSSCFFLPAPPGARFFDPLTFNIEKLFATGKSPYPVERTLLTSTILDHAMHSLKNGSAVVSDASLKVAYRAPADSGFFRGTHLDNP